MNNNKKNTVGEDQKNNPTTVVISSSGPTPASVGPPMGAPIVPTLGSTVAPTLSESQLLSQTTQQPAFSVRNGSSRRGLVHSVSIIVEPAMADGDDDDQFDADQRPIPSVSTERRNTIAGPYVVLEDFGFGKSFVKYQRVSNGLEGHAQVVLCCAHESRIIAIVAIPGELLTIICHAIYGSIGSVRRNNCSINHSQWHKRKDPEDQCLILNGYCLSRQ